MINIKIYKKVIHLKCLFQARAIKINESHNQRTITSKTNQLTHPSTHNRLNDNSYSSK